MSPPGAVDIAVLCLSLLAAVAVGFWSGRKSQDAESYLLGGRDLPWWAILGSIVATETSTATVLSVPGVAFGETGMKFLQIAIGYIVGRMIVVRVLLPLYFQGKLFTAYQVLDRRFGSATKTAASLLVSGDPKPWRRSAAVPGRRRCKRIAGLAI